MTSPRVCGKCGVPIVGWSEQRRKSRYASFQCLQALGYQSLGYTIWLLSYLVLVILFLIVLALALELADQNGTPPGTMNATWAWIFVFVLVGWFILYLVFPILAAVACALGKDFRYPILGNRLANIWNIRKQVPRRRL